MDGTRDCIYTSRKMNARPWVSDGKRMKQRKMNDHSNAEVNEWMDGWLNVWMDVCMHASCIQRCIGVWMHPIIEFANANCKSIICI